MLTSLVLVATDHGRMTNYAFNSAITACGKCGRWKEALQLLEAMPKARIRPDIFRYEKRHIQKNQNDNIQSTYIIHFSLFIIQAIQPPLLRKFRKKKKEK